MRENVKHKLSSVISEDEIPCCDSITSVSKFRNDFKKLPNTDATVPLILDVEETLDVQRKLSYYDSA